MNFIKNISIAFFAIFLVTCQTNKKTLSKEELKYKFQKDSDKIYFTIMQLNDVYEIAPIQGGKFGGMARVETVHQELLKEDPNTMLVLAGDFLNPSLLGTIKVNGERIRGRQMVDVMNAMNFDLVAFGNHEFDLSYSNLQKRLNESKFDWISANVFHNEDGKNSKFFKKIGGEEVAVPETFTKKFSNGKESVNIGFISVCIPSNPRSFVTYTDMYKEAKRSYNEIKGKTDVVLGLTHVKFEQDQKIAEILPEIPLIMGGHEHTNIYEKQGGTIITKADANAKTVYIHRFEYDPKTKKLAVKSELKTIDDIIEVNAKVDSVVQKWQKLLNEKIKEIVAKPNEIVYTTEEKLDARDTPIRSKQTNMGEIVAASMSKAYNNEVDAAFVNGGSIRIDDVLTGNISAIDIFRVLPYGGAILKVKLKGALLKEVLDYGVKAGGTGAYLQRFNISKDEKGDWLVKNESIKNDKVYTVATSDYLLKGFDIPFLKPDNIGVIEVYEPKNTEIAYDVRKAVINYLKQ